MVRLEDVVINFRCDFAICDAVINKAPYGRLNIVVYFTCVQLNINITGTRAEPCDYQNATYILSERAPLTKTF